MAGRIQRNHEGQEDILVKFMLCRFYMHTHAHTHARHFVYGVWDGGKVGRAHAHTQMHTHTHTYTHIHTSFCFIFLFYQQIIEIVNSYYLRFIGSPRRILGGSGVSSNYVGADPTFVRTSPSAIATAEAVFATSKEYCQRAFTIYNVAFCN